MRNVWIVIALLIFVAERGMASDLMPQDFAEGIVLECPEGTTVCRYTVPNDVYDTLVRPDFSDICMFNGNGHVIPYTMQHLNGKVVSRKEVLPSAILPIFPVYRDKTDGSGENISYTVVADSRGTLICLSPRQGIPRGLKPKDEPLYYIVDGSALKTMPGRLAFEWNGSKNSVVRLKISGSDTLDTWSVLVDSAVIADIRMGGNDLKQKEVSLPAQSFKYLKISGQSESNRILIDRITAHFEADHVEDIPRKWVRLHRFKKIEDSSGLVFRMNGFRPVDRLRVIFPEKNTLMHTEISSREPWDKAWSKLFQGLLYRLDVQGADIENSVVSFAPLSHGLYKIKVDEGGTGTEDSLVVEAGFLPHTLLFMAQGNGPYVLAYGRGIGEKGGPIDNGMEDFLTSMDQEKENVLIKDARFIEKKKLGGPVRLKKQKITPSLKQVVLWIFLVASVILCAYMAMTLYRQMMHGRRDSGKGP